MKIEDIHLLQQTMNLLDDSLLNQRDILLQITSRMDNQSLEKLSHTILWLLIREFAGDEYFWYLRVQHLLGIDLRPRSRASSTTWKKTYHSLLNISLGEHEYQEVLTNKLLKKILLEIRNQPSVLGRTFEIDCEKIIKLSRVCSDNKEFLSGILLGLSLAENK